MADGWQQRTDAASTLLYVQRRRRISNMAEQNNTEQTGDANLDKNVSPEASTMMVIVKTPNGKEEIAISEDSSVAQVRSLTFYQHVAAEVMLTYDDTASRQQTVGKLLRRFLTCRPVSVSKIFS